MKKKQTNTLGSWIDLGELKRLTKALAPEGPESGGDGQVDAADGVPDTAEVGLPKRGLDIGTPEAYRAAPFPGQGIAARGETPEEKEETGGAEEDRQEQTQGPVLKAARALAEVHLRAEENGFLRRRELKTADPDSPAIAVPPVFESRQESTAPPASAAADPEGDIAGEVAAGDSFEVPRAPLRERLEAFVDWAMRLTGASRMVIVDGQGYSLLHRDLEARASEGDPAMVDSAMRLTSVLEQVQARTDFARDGALNLPLEEGGWLDVLRCETGGGRLCIALVTAEPLGIAQSTLMKSELVQTMEAGS